MHWLQRFRSIAYGQKKGQFQDSFFHWKKPTDLIGGISDGEDVRRQVTQPAVLVQLNILRVVNGIKFEWINGDEDGADISVNMAFVEARFQILQKCLLCQVWQLA